MDLLILKIKVINNICQNPIKLLWKPSSQKAQMPVNVLNLLSELKDDIVYICLKQCFLETKLTLSGCAFSSHPKVSSTQSLPRMKSIQSLERRQLFYLKIQVVLLGVTVFWKLLHIAHEFKTKGSHMRVKSPGLWSILKPRDLSGISIGSFSFYCHICKSPVESLQSTVPSNEVMFCAQGSNILRSRCLP